MTGTGEAAAAGGPLAALSVRPFRWWFVGQVTSASGLMTQMVATAWLVLRWHGGGVELALLSSASLAPTLALGLWAGTLIDRHDRRLLLICTQTLLATLSLILYLLIVSGAASYWLIVAVSAAAGVVTALDAPARQVYVLDLVGEQRLAGAVSLYEVVLNLSRVFGPALGGLLLAISGPAACVLANTASFAAPLAVLLRYRSRAAAVEPGPAGGRPRAREGMRYAWSAPLLRACLLLAAAGGILFNFTVLLPLLATRAFHLGAGGYGLLLALFGVGALPGALLAARGGAAPGGRQVGWLAICTGACMAATAAAPDLPILFAGMAATGTASIWMIACANTLVQLRAAPELRGRVMGAWTVALPGTIPLTGLAAGALADACGPRIAFAATGALIAAIALACWRGLTQG